MQDLQVETFGSMERREKVDFILEQMRLLKLQGDWEKLAIVGRGSIWGGWTMMLKTRCCSFPFTLLFYFADEDSMEPRRTWNWGFTHWWSCMDYTRTLTSTYASIIDQFTIHLLSIPFPRLRLHQQINNRQRRTKEQTLYWGISYSLSCWLLTITNRTTCYRGFTGTRGWKKWRNASKSLSLFSLSPPCDGRW